MRTHRVRECERRLEEARLGWGRRRKVTKREIAKVRDHDDLKRREEGKRDEGVCGGTDELKDSSFQIRTSGTFYCAEGWVYT